MKKLVGVLIVLVMCLGTVGALAKPLIPPAPSNDIYVQDYAEVLSQETKEKMVLMGKDIRDKTKAQIVVVTIKSLDGVPIEEYALEVLRQWGIGDKTLNNGVLMLVAVNDRKSRIEVGTGLEGALPDGKTGQIQDEQMIPSFKDGDYESGIWKGYKKLANVVMAEYGETIVDEEEETWIDIVIAILFMLAIPAAVWLIGYLFSNDKGSGSNGGSRRDRDDYSSSDSSSYDSGGGGSGSGGGSSRDW